MFDDEENECRKLEALKAISGAIEVFGKSLLANLELNRHQKLKLDSMDQKLERILIAVDRSSHA